MGVVRDIDEKMSCDHVVPELHDDVIQQYGSDQNQMNVWVNFRVTRNIKSWSKQ